MASAPIQLLYLCNTEDFSDWGKHFMPLFCLQGNAKDRVSYTLQQLLISEHPVCPWRL